MVPGEISPPVIWGSFISQAVTSLRTAKQGTEFATFEHRRDLERFYEIRLAVVPPAILRCEEARY